ncbi:uncharacterized protein [Lolium perenne]|uniref:uncharacterized protein n=1 Tax=Lolium perenne TaxID=4522 RepID=UPI0021F576A3|nr:uncharacterized protein LOC127319129 [Lolium perenne]
MVMRTLHREEEETRSAHHVTRSTTRPPPSCCRYLTFFSGPNSQVTVVVLRYFLFLCRSTVVSPAPPRTVEKQSDRSRRRRGHMAQQRKFRLCDMLPNVWFYKLRDMGSQGRGGLRRSASARCYREVPQQPSWNRGSSERWNREVDVQQPRPSLSSREVDNQQEEPVTPTKGSPLCPLPRRASYYYSTRDREVPRTPRPKDAQSPTRSSRRRNRAGHSPEGARQVSAPVPVHGKEPALDTPGSSCRRRDMSIKNDGGEPWRPTVTAPPDGGLDVKVITSESEIIIDLPNVDTPGRRLRPILTRPARRQPQPREPDGSHVDLADVTVRERDKDLPDGGHADHADVTARASSTAEKSSVSKPSRSSASSSSGHWCLKTRVKGPRLAATARRGKPPARNRMAPVIAESYPVVMVTRDPRTDFRESMEEMISAKGIRDAGDLEDLLACYLSLNDAEHHDLIIEVFEQIWMSLANSKP